MTSPAITSLDVPAVARCALGWDDQHLAQQGAGELLADADTSGFTDRVQPAAERFVTAWCALLRELGQGCEGQADGLRETALSLVRADGITGASFVAELFLRERR